jgi:hypothetical protein
MSAGVTSRSIKRNQPGARARGGRARRTPSPSEAQSARRQEATRTSHRSNREPTASAEQRRPCSAPAGGAELLSIEWSRSIRARAPRGRRRRQATRSPPPGARLLRRRAEPGSFEEGVAARRRDGRGRVPEQHGVARDHAADSQAQLPGRAPDRGRGPSGRRGGESDLRRRRLRRGPDSRLTRPHQAAHGRPALAARCPSRCSTRSPISCPSRIAPESAWSSPPGRLADPRRPRASLPRRRDRQLPPALAPAPPLLTLAGARLRDGLCQAVVGAQRPRC